MIQFEFKLPETMPASFKHIEELMESTREPNPYFYSLKCVVLIDPTLCARFCHFDPISGQASLNPRNNASFNCHTTPLPSLIPQADITLHIMPVLLIHTGTG